MTSTLTEAIGAQRESIRLSPWRQVIETQRRLAMEVLMNADDYSASQCEVARRILANNPRGESHG